MTLEHTLSDITRQLDDWQGINEAQTAQAIVLRILHALGYDIWNPFEVVPEVSGNSGRPDYIIQLDSDIRFVIEVKVLGRNLADTEKDMTQAVNYINHLGKRWAILTNGQEWLFLDNTIRSETSQKRALTINLERHAKHAANYLERLLSKQHWQKTNAEDDLAPIITDIREDIQRRLELGKIADKLADKIGNGFSKDEQGIRAAVQYVLDSNERQLAETEASLEFLVKRLLDGEEINGIKQGNPEPPVPVTIRSRTPASVKLAIIEGITRSMAFLKRQRRSELQAWFDGELLEANSWRNVYAGIAEAIITLKGTESLNELVQINDNTTDRLKASGQPYEVNAYRELSNGKFLYYHYSADRLRANISKLLEYLEVKPQSLKVLYDGETYYLP